MLERNSQKTTSSFFQKRQKAQKYVKPARKSEYAAAKTITQEKTGISATR